MSDNDTGEDPLARYAGMADKVAETERREAMAQAWLDAAQETRAEVEQLAREWLVKTRTRPSWELPEYGIVTLPLSRGGVAVGDIDKLKAWTQEHHPEHIRTVTEVHVAFQKWLLSNAEVVDGVAVHPDTKAPIPGLTVRPAGIPQPVRFTPDSGVKAVYAQYAAARVKEALAEEYGHQGGAA